MKFPGYRKLLKIIKHTYFNISRKKVIGYNAMHRRTDQHHLRKRLIGKEIGAY